MGQKGDKHSNEAALSAELLIEKLASIMGITSKKMFGGHGIFHEGKMFGMVDPKGRCLFKVDTELEKEYIKQGAEKYGKMPYYSIPTDIFNSNTIVDWAKKSISIV